ncbi:hypothetical protein [Moorena sp. SIO3A2]|uniref:hypothetical protein n=1 Tax=Moorena sp. SIO3A2 TaxID=2607841 RepID=UPI0013B92FB7|nr:hypothetical protein [Moorena sp. SIO3A2]NER90372.1 hypothetical protein [Moorena sp. SIO3A2]
MTTEAERVQNRNKIFISRERTNSLLEGRWMADIVQPHHMLIGGARVAYEDFYYDSTTNEPLSWPDDDENFHPKIVLYSGTILYRLRLKTYRNKYQFSINEREDNSWRGIKSLYTQGIEANASQGIDEVPGNPLIGLDKNLYLLDWGLVYNTVHDLVTERQCDLVLGGTGFRIYENELPEWSFLEPEAPSSQPGDLTPLQWDQLKRYQAIKEHIHKLFSISNYPIGINEHFIYKDETLA